MGITTDKFDLERGKINSHNTLMERIEAVKSTGYADQIIIEEYKGQKIDDIRKYEVDVFVIGSDWEGYFDYLKEYCKVVYLPRTEGISSTLLRGERSMVKMGIIGPQATKESFIRESKVVNSIDVDLNASPDECDAIYVASPNNLHYYYVKNALEKGKHVLCEAPLALSTKQAEELLLFAERNNLVLMQAHKTAYCPAFRHLVSLLKSRVIGDIEDINVSMFLPSDIATLDYPFSGCFDKWACFPVLPIIKLLGTEFRDIYFYSKKNQGVDFFSKAVFRYNNSVASFQIGLGTSSENNLIISGTKGYAYVSSPWWKTDYFEIRYEDPNLNKKFFYPFIGEGLCYEIKDFISCIQTGSFQEFSKKEILKMTEVQERFMDGNNVFSI